MRCAQQAVIGGQPLLIVGVAEPIVLLYSYMYNFAKDKPDVGAALLKQLVGKEPLYQKP